MVKVMAIAILAVLTGLITCYLIGYMDWVWGLSKVGL